MNIPADGVGLIYKPMILRHEHPVAQIRCGHQQLRVIQQARLYLRYPDTEEERREFTRRMHTNLIALDPQVTPELLHDYIRNTLMPLIAEEDARQAVLERQFMKDFMHGSFRKWYDNASQLALLRNKYLTQWRINIMNWAVREAAHCRRPPKFKELMAIPNSANELAYAHNAALWNLKGPEKKKKLKPITKNSKLYRLMYALWGIMLDRNRTRDIAIANLNIREESANNTTVKTTPVEILMDVALEFDIPKEQFLYFYDALAKTHRRTGESAPDTEQRKNALKLLDQWE